MYDPKKDHVEPEPSKPAHPTPTMLSRDAPATTTKPATAPPALVPGELYFRKAFVMERLAAYRERVLARVKKANDYQLLLDVSRETQLMLDVFEDAGDPLPVE